MLTDISQTYMSPHWRQHCAKDDLFGELFQKELQHHE